MLYLRNNMYIDQHCPIRIVHCNVLSEYFHVIYIGCYWFVRVHYRIVERNNCRDKCYNYMIEYDELELFVLRVLFCFDRWNNRIEPIEDRFGPLHNIDIDHDYPIHNNHRNVHVENYHERYIDHRWRLMEHYRIVEVYIQLYWLLVLLSMLLSSLLSDIDHPIVSNHQLYNKLNNNDHVFE